MLRELEIKDAQNMMEWMMDRELTKYFRFNGDSMKYEDVISFIEESKKNSNTMHFAITDSSDRYLGTISLKNIDYVNQNAEFAIVIRKSAQGTGAALEATRQILNKAFNEFGLHKVYLNVLESNKRAIRFYEKFGFEMEGRFKEFVYSTKITAEGRFFDLLWYSMTADDYRNVMGR